MTDELPEAVLIDVPVALSEEMQLLGLPGSFERPTLRGPDVGTAVSIVSGTLGAGSAAVSIAIAREQLQEMAKRTLAWMRRESPSSEPVITLKYQNRETTLHVTSRTTDKDFLKKLIGLIDASTEPE